jgi:drug/metabolite transporter (DMT)-like permease
MTLAPFFMKPYLKIVAAMLIWSTWGLLIRWLALPPVVVLFYTSLIASFAVPIALRIRGEFPASILSKGPRNLFAALVFASLLNNLTYFYSLGHTTVSNAVFAHYTAPVIVAVLAPFLISERIQKVTLISLPIAVAGMAMIVVSSGGLRLNSVHLPGILAGTASGIAYAFVIIVSREISRRMMYHKAIIVLLWATAIVTAPVALSMDYRLPVHSALLLLATGLLHSTIAPLLYFSALRQVLAQHAAILGYTEPLAAIPLAFVFLSETPSFAALIGGVLILFSGYLVVHARLRPQAET